MSRLPSPLSVPRCGRVHCVSDGGLQGEQAQVPCTAPRWLRAGLGSWWAAGVPGSTGREGHAWLGSLPSLHTELKVCSSTCPDKGKREQEAVRGTSWPTPAPSLKLLRLPVKSRCSCGLPLHRPEGWQGCRRGARAGSSQPAHAAEARRAHPPARTGICLTLGVICKLEFPNSSSSVPE